jgi:hypothetical protein
MISYLKKLALIVGAVGALAATTYVLLLGCGEIQVQARPNSSAPMPVTVSPPGSRLDDLQGTFAVDASQTPAYLEWRASCPAKPVTDNFKEASGARAVRVTYPGLKAPLYGLLALCRLPEGYSGAASRSYRVEIPQSYVDATDGGRVSVVYEPFDYNGSELVAWSLWLSRDPNVFGGAPPADPNAPRRLGGDVAH